jgi:two-component system response regulator HydG
LRKLVQAGTFRQDLLYRLEGVAIEVPPLRQRREDIPLLSQRMLDEARARHPQTRVDRFSPAALRAMLEYRWTGNVRELEHAIGRAVLLARGPSIEPEDLPSSVSSDPRTKEASFGDEVIPVRELQRRYVAWAFERCAGRKMITCEKLGIDSKTLARWLSSEDE